MEDRPETIAEKCDALEKQYFERFGKGIPLPFGIGLLGTWTDEVYAREYEIALKTGIPLEPGTERWRELFGDPKKTPPDVVI